MDEAKFSEFLSSHRRLTKGHAKQKRFVANLETYADDQAIVVLNICMIQLFKSASVAAVSSSAPGY